MNTVVTPWSGCGTAAETSAAENVAINRHSLAEIAHRDRT